VTIDNGGRLNRRDLLKYGLQGAAVLAAGNVLAACGSASSGSGAATGAGPAVSTGPSSTGSPIRGGTLRIGVLSTGSSETIDIRKAVNTPDFVRVFNLYDPLFQQVPGGVAPALATSGEPNKDATVWTLKLRDGVTFHNGKPFSADDVVYTINTWGTKQSNYQAQAAALIDLKGVRKLDRLTVHVPLLRPFADFPAFTAWFTALVVPDGATDFNKPVGTGPFKYGSFIPGTSSTFAANPNYWRGVPYVDQLVVNSSYTDDGARVNALLSGQIDITPGIPPALAKANAGSGQLVLGNSPGPAYIPVVMRVDAPPFNDPRVVQAFKLAVDRQAIINDAFAGYATLGNDSPGATLNYWAPDIKPTYDPQKAKSLLKAAGHENLSLPLYTAEALPGMNETAAIVSAQLKAIGVNAPVTQLPVATYFTSASPGYLTPQRHLSMTYWNVVQPGLGAYYDSAMTPAGQFNETGWGHGPGQETLINAALGETDPATAQQNWLAAQQQQVQQGGNLLPAFFNYLDGYSPHVRGVVTNQAGNNANYVYYKGWLAK
jgi:peptide/nickel transport system substrate-binding protein